MSEKTSKTFTMNQCYSTIVRNFIHEFLGLNKNTAHILLYIISGLI